jgi:hypothetical protein
VVPNGFVRVNVNNISCASNGSGLTITNDSQVRLTNDCILDPGDVIVRVGNISCSNTRLSLAELISQAYQSGVLVIVVRDINTGDLVECNLPPPDEGTPDGDE